MPPVPSREGLYEWDMLPIKMKKKMYESNTALCTYWIPESVEPTRSDKL